MRVARVRLIDKGIEDGRSVCLMVARLTWTRIDSELVTDQFEDFGGGLQGSDRS